MGVLPAIFEKQIAIKLLHPASTLKSRIQVKFIFSTAIIIFISTIINTLVLKIHFKTKGQ
ncbi:MAG: hypothetical protein P8X74_12080 [Reinekea sp.]